MSHIKKYFLKKIFIPPPYVGNCAAYFKKMSVTKGLGVMQRNLFFYTKAKRFHFAPPPSGFQPSAQVFSVFSYLLQIFDLFSPQYQAITQLYPQILTHYIVIVSQLLQLISSADIHRGDNTNTIIPHRFTSLINYHSLHAANYSSGPMYTRLPGSLIAAIQCPAGSCRDHAGIASGSCRDHAGITTGSYLDHNWSAKEHTRSCENHTPN